MKFLFLLGAINTLEKWIRHPRVAQLISVIDDVETNCLATFVSPRHVIAAEVCTRGEMKVKAYADKHDLKEVFLGLYQVQEKHILTYNEITSKFPI